MLFGPVFQLELVATARRARYYALRTAYGLILLFFVATYSPGLRARPAEPGVATLTIQQMAALGQAIYWTFVSVQSFAVLLLTPALVAGVIADERQRKTLQFLLASRLTSGEIVLGKLASRLLHVGVFLSLGLPILSLLSLFGGVDPRMILVTYAVTISTAFFLAGLSILVSTHAPRPREAISLAYLLVLVWLVVPTMIKFLMPFGSWPWSTIYAWVKPVNDWVAATSPFALIDTSVSSPQRFWEVVAWMIGLQVACGASFVLIAIARLRPLARREGGRSRWLAAWGGKRRGRRFLPRPECGNDAMLWKERYVSTSSATTKIVGLSVGLMVGLALLQPLHDLALPAFTELWEYGYGASGISARHQFNQFLRFICTLIYVAWGLGVASSAASGLTAEREQDTWISLISTPLSGVEILRAKMLGAAWGLRGLGVLLVLFWLTGLAAGSVHPLALVAVALETAVFIWFAAALGTSLSLLSQRSARALFATIMILGFLNGGYLFCCIPLEPDTAVVALGVTPFVEAASLFSYGSDEMIGSREGPDYVLMCVLSVIAYGIGALYLTIGACQRFDTIVDRPRRTRPGPPPPAVSKPDELSSDELI